jgi:hypothetical protein
VTVFLVSFHGGTTGSSINNLGVFSSDGTARDPFYALGPAASSAGSGAAATSIGALPSLNELRAVLSTSTALYVVNAYKDFSQVLIFEPTASTDGFWAFTGVYADKAAELAHPFDVIAGPSGLLVSNQDTNDVVSFTGPGATGTVVQSGFSAVRGLAWDGQALYVADSGADLVHLYPDADSSKVTSFPVEKPVHLLYDDGTQTLFIGSEKDNSVLVFDTTSPASSSNPQTLIHGSKSGLDHTAGLALIDVTGTTATLLVASRVGHQVISYPLALVDGAWTWQPATRTTFLHEHQLGDDPEFIVAVG